MSAREMKALERRWVGEWNKGKAASMATLKEYLTTDFVEHSGIGEDIHGIKEYQNLTTTCIMLFQTCISLLMT
jgi:hypothetical protein